MEGGKTSRCNFPLLVIDIDSGELEIWRFAGSNIEGNGQLPLLPGNPPYLFMDSPLLQSLLAAKKSSAASLQATLTHLQAAHSLLLSHPSAASFISRPVLELLSRLGQVLDYQVVKQVSQLYTLLSRLLPRTEVGLQIDLSNDILLLADQYRGTRLAFELGTLGLELLVELLKSGRISEEQRTAIQVLVNKKPKSDLEQRLSQVEADLRAGRINGISKLMDVFSSNTSLREQLDLFGTKVVSILSSLQGQTDPDMLLKLYQFLDQVMFQVHYRVALPGEPPSSRVFVNADSQLLANNENCFYSALAALKLLLRGGLPRPVVKILRRLWVLYPGLRANLYEITTNCMTVLASSEGPSDLYSSSAAAFLYFLRHSPDVELSFLALLNSVPNIDSLTQLRQYDPSSLSQFPETDTAADLDKLQIFSGYPVAARIPAGERFSHVVDLDEAGCVLVWGFATEFGDISYTITRLEDGEQVEVRREVRVQADKVPALGSLLIPAPGFIKFEWDNSFSWFREKHLRYRITVLRPVSAATDSLAQASSTYLSPIDLLHRDVGEPSGDNACYGDPSASVLEIGVHIGETVTEMQCMDAFKSVQNGQLSGHLSDLVTEAVASLGTKPHYVKLGIVSKAPSFLADLDSFGTVAVARDAVALAYFSQRSLKTAHTLIAIVVEAGVRSAVLHRGKLLTTEKGQALGDLARLPVAALSDGIAVLLGLFGPAVVVVAGKDLGQSLAVLAEEVRGKVALEVWQHSVLRESVLGKTVLLQAAAQLNALHYHFKHTF